MFKKIYEAGDRYGGQVMKCQKVCCTKKLIFNLEKSEKPFKGFQAIKCLDQIFIF